MKLKKLAVLMFTVLFTLTVLASCAATAAESPSSSPDVGSEATESAVVSGDSPLGGDLPPAWADATDTALDAETYDSYTVALAKNEKEGATLVISSDRDVSDVTVKTTVSGAGSDSDLAVEVFEEYSLSYTSGLSDKVYTEPEILVPYGDAQIDLKKGEKTLLLIRPSATSDTPAGDYSVYVEVSDGDKTLSYATLGVTVWDITLDEGAVYDTAFGFDYASLERLDPDATYQQYYDMALEYGMCLYNLPFDALTDEADAYMSDPRVACFCLPISDAETIAKYRDKIMANPDWAEKAYFYVGDEPSSQAQADTIYKTCAEIHDVWPEAHIVTPLVFVSEFTKSDGSGTGDSFECFSDCNDIWCLQSSNFSGDAYTEQLDKLRARGDRVWWYVCNSPARPCCNYLYYNSTMEGRELFWQQYQRNITGLLYWSTTYWTNTDDPWVKPANFDMNGLYIYGDGGLFYNGSKIGKPGPVAGLRMDSIRNGVEDLKLFKLAEDKFGHDYVNEKIAKVTKSLSKVTQNYSDIAAIRAEIAKDLLAAK